MYYGGARIGARSSGRFRRNPGGQSIAMEAVPVGSHDLDADGETSAVVATLPSRRSSGGSRRGGIDSTSPTRTTLAERGAIWPAERAHSDGVDSRRRFWIQAIPRENISWNASDRGDSPGSWEVLAGSAWLAACRGIRDASAPVSTWYAEQWSRAAHWLEALAHLGAVTRGLARDSAIVPAKVHQSLASSVFRVPLGGGSVIPLPVIEIDLAALAGELFDAGPWHEHVVALETAITFRLALDRDGRWSREMNTALNGCLLQNVGREFVPKDIPARGLDHSRAGAATLAGLEGMSPSIPPMVAFHHRHPAPLFRGADRSSLRTPRLARGAAAVVRLIELEHMLRPLVRKDMSIRKTALDQLLRETDGMRGERYWVDMLQRNLRDSSSSRESAVVLFPRLAANGVESVGEEHAAKGRVDLAEPLPGGPHAGATHFVGQPFVADAARELRRATMSRRANVPTAELVGEERDR